MVTLISDVLLIYFALSLTFTECLEISNQFVNSFKDIIRIRESERYVFEHDTFYENPS